MNESILIEVAKPSLYGLPTRFKGKPVKDKIMDMKSILLPIVIVAGWLILFGVILPALGINT